MRVHSCGRLILNRCMTGLGARAKGQNLNNRQVELQGYVRFSRQKLPPVSDAGA